MENLKMSSISFNLAQYLLNENKIDEVFKEIEKRKILESSKNTKEKIIKDVFYFLMAYHLQNEHVIDNDE